MFEAKFGGACGACEERIRPGQRVTYVEDVLVHSGCANVEFARSVPRRPAEVCTTCFIEKPCGCGEF